MAIYGLLCWEEPDAHNMNMIMKDLPLMPLPNDHAA